MHQLSVAMVIPTAPLATMPGCERTDTYCTDTYYTTYSMHLEFQENFTTFTS